MLRPTLILLGLFVCQCNPGAKEKSNGSSEPGSSASAPSSKADTSSRAPKGEPPAGWTSFSPTGAGFSVWLPGKAEKLDAAGSTMYAAKRENGSAYSVQCMDLGKDASKRDVADTLTGMRRGRIGERTVLSESKIDDARGVGHKLAIELETTKGKLVTNELLLAKGQFVCGFSALIASKQDESAEIKTFFDSAEVSP